MTLCGLPSVVGERHCQCGSMFVLEDGVNGLGSDLLLLRLPQSSAGTLDQCVAGKQSASIIPKEVQILAGIREQLNNRCDNRPSIGL